MKVVIAPDSFKESLTAKQVSDAIKRGLKRVWKDAEFVTIPVADGGEGTVQALIDATQGELVVVSVKGPLGTEINAHYGILGDRETAVIEMAEASGLHLVPQELRDPKRTSSFGTGQLILDALDKGIQRFIIGLGGSATNDGGIGMLAALGVRFLNQAGEEITPDGAGLVELVSIDHSTLDARLAECDFLVACDVDNPLCGEEGASKVFGPQKGATKEDIELLDGALKKFGELTEQVMGRHVLTEKGAGAAGGMGAALMGFLSSSMKPGIEIVLDTVKLSEHVSDADIVFTGEGRIDQQTIHGKTPMGVAKVAKQFDLPVIALAGCTGENYQAVYECGIDAVFVCVSRAMSLPEALEEADINLENLAENVARLSNLSMLSQTQVTLSKK
ncbi:glycerate kinase [Vibrio sp. J1-1]|uniref:glycerate kinase n=1 Tax=Vibrio sp. J1-1 TaxID=2912251 RepID=UPI001DB705E4|nr:glycerate kinase [Vibrio sp. J1-1]MBR9786464.1 glycerate kinase [Vibrionaceae bacterium]MCF7480914.1 glycerate kinase [Vibrio sp. J1-1]